MPQQPSERASPTSAPGGAPRPEGERDRAIDRPTNRSASDPADASVRLLRRNQGRWKLSFSLFLLGFMLLIVVARKNPPAAEAWALRGTAAALCVGAFFLARQARHNPRA